MVSFATGPLERLAYVWQLRSGDHDERDDVITMRAHQVTVSGEDFFLAADGEISGPERRRSWHLERAAYSMIVPARRSARPDRPRRSRPRRRTPHATALSFSTLGSPASAK